MTDTREAALTAAIWQALQADERALSSLAFEGPRQNLPSVYAVDALASASVAAASLATAQLYALRNPSTDPVVRVDRRHAAVAFRSERYLKAVGWELPPAWDPIAGDYRTRDGFIRLHTNYQHHRTAVLRVLNTPAHRESVGQAVKTWPAEALETAIVNEGGAAAALRTAHEFATHPQGRALEQEPLFAITTRAARPLELGAADRPLSGVRVLDLTRVIAGPVCTRFLAAYGADVLRIDPPGFEEVGALLAETTTGKRRAALDLRHDADRGTFEHLVLNAHVLVHGFRSDALERLGFGLEWRQRHNPSLIGVSLDAYGFSGPWAARRGFDSLVQMSVGIAAKGQAIMNSPAPFPLPAQALDHATGYLMAAAVARALVRLTTDGEASEIRTSLARTARALMQMGDDGDPRSPDLSPADAAPYLENANSAWGPVERVRCPGCIEGVAPRWTIDAGPLGSDRPMW